MTPDPTHLHHIAVLATCRREGEHTHKGHAILLGAVQLQGVGLSDVPVVGAITACKYILNAISVSLAISLFAPRAARQPPRHYPLRKPQKGNPPKQAPSVCPGVMAIVTP